MSINKYFLDNRTFSFKYNLSELIFWSVVVISALGYLLFSLPAMPYSHDWEYSAKLNELGFWLFITEHYTLVNGSVFMHLLIALFGKHYSLWLIINAIVIMLFPLIMLSAIRKGNDRFKLTDALVFVAWLGFLSNFTSDFYQIGFFWMTGSLNYIWPTLMVMVVYRLYWKGLLDFNQWSKAKFNLILVFTLLSSTTHEILALVTLGLVVTKIIFVRWETGLIYSRLTWSVVTSLTGFILLIFAPGNFVRLDDAEVSILSVAAQNAEYIASHAVNSPVYQVVITSLLTLIALFSFITPATNNLSLWPKRVASLLAITLISYFYLVFSFEQLTSIHYAWLRSFIIGQLIFSVLLFIIWNKPALAILGLLAVSSSLVVLAVSGIGPGVMLPNLLFYGCLILGLLVDLLDSLRKRMAIIVAIFSLCLLAVGISEARSVYRMYSTNEQAWQVIHHKIEAWKNEGNKTNIISLRRLPEPKAHWAMPYQNHDFTEYFYRYFDIPKGTIIAWEGKHADSNQLSILEDLPSFGNVLEKNKKKPKIKFIQNDRYCQAEYIENKIIFSYEIWGCGVGSLFNIELLDNNDAIQAYYRGSLRQDELMVAVTGLDGAYSMHQIYSLPTQISNVNEPRKLRLSWLGYTLESNY